MVTSVQVSMNNIIEDIRRMVGEGRTESFIMAMVRDEHGPGYGGMVIRAIRQIEAEKENA